MKQVAADFVLREHCFDCVFLIDGCLASASAFHLNRERRFQVLSEPKVIDDKTAGLVAKDSVHSRDSLHQSMSAHRLIDVHRVQTRHNEPCQPHVANEYDLYRAALVIIAVPRGAQMHDRVVEVNADSSAHADDHCLAVHCAQSLVEMTNEIVGNERDTFLGSYDCFELGPLCL
jgi:hypothetical protein